MKKIVAYTRVSTKQQGIGLDAQLTIIENYAAAHGCEIIARYSEKESGKETINRPQLHAAIATCKQTGAVLVVAKLDRLSRDVADIFTLKRNTQFSFEVCDMDASDTMMLGIFATLAQKERELISKRTREALAALKAKGVQLGNPNAAEHMRTINARGSQARKDNATNNPANRHAWNAIRLMAGTLQEKADFLNAEGYTTPTGKKFTRIQVSRLIQRFA